MDGDGDAAGAPASLASVLAPSLVARYLPHASMPDRQSMALPPMDRQPGRPLGILIAPSDTAVLTRILVTSSALTVSPISVNSSLLGFFFAYSGRHGGLGHATHV